MPNCKVPVEKEEEKKGEKLWRDMRTAYSGNQELYRVGKMQELATQTPRGI